MTIRMVSAIAACSIALLFLGTLLWGFAMPFLFPDAPVPGGAGAESPNFAFVFLAQVFFAVFLVTLVGRWTGSYSFKSAFVVGGIAGLLITAATTFSYLAVIPDGNVIKAVVEPLLAAPVHGAAAGLASVILRRDASDPQ